MPEEALTLENSHRLIQRNILISYISTIAYTLGGSFLNESYIQAYLLQIGMDTMSIGIYGTFSQVAALLGYVLFLIYRPKNRTRYVRNIMIYGLLGCIMPLALIGSAYVRFASLLLYAGVSVYQITMAMKSVCEFSAMPMLYPRERYGRISAKCGMIGSALAAVLSAVSAPFISDGSSLMQYLIFFALAFFGLLASALSAKAYTPMESLLTEEETVSKRERIAIPEMLKILFPHFLRGVATACFYYFVAVSFSSVTLSAIGQSIFITVGVLSTMAACGVFMKLQDRFRTGPIILVSNIIAAASVILTCLNTSEIGFFALYVIYTLTINITAYAIPAGVMYCTPADKLPFISSTRLLVMSGATSLLLTPIAGLLDVFSAWQVMAAGGAIHILSGVIFAVQYTDKLKNRSSQ